MERELGGPAVVLRVVDYGEVDAVVTLLTRDHGRVSAFAKAARSTRKPRFGAALELFSQVEIRFRPRRGDASLVSLTAADVVEPHAGLRRDFTRVAWASYAAEAVREGTREGEDSGVVFRLLTGYLSALAGRGATLEDRTAFELTLLAALGLAPRLEGCTRCGDTNPKLFHTLSPAAGGLVCARCADSAHGLLSPGTVRSLRGVAGTIPPDKPRVAFTGRVAEELGGALPAYVEAALGRPLRTRGFLDVMPPATAGR